MVKEVTDWTSLQTQLFDSEDRGDNPLACNYLLNLSYYWYSLMVDPNLMNHLNISFENLEGKKSKENKNWDLTKNA